MSEYDEYKKRSRESIEVAKLKMSSPNGGAGALEDKEYVPLKPVTFKQKWDNYWYHYKWQTFGSAFAIILVFTFVWQMIFKTVYDAKLAIVTEYPFDALTESYEDKFSTIATDFTKNGKKDVEVVSYQQDYSGENKLSPEIVQANFVKLSASLSELENFVYVLDSKSYEQFKSMEVNFMDLSKKVDSKKLVGNDKYSLKGTKLAKLMQIDKVEDDIYICFIDYDSLDARRKEKKNIKTNYQRDMEFFNKLVAYE